MKYTLRHIEQPTQTARILTLLIAIMLVIVCSGCEALFCGEEELYRISSPDGRVDSVLTRESCGGVSIPFLYKIYVVPKGNMVKKEDLVFAANHLAKESITWSAPQRLEIKYRKAIIKQYKNLWDHKDVDDYEYKVEIRERAESAETAVDVGDGTTLEQLRKEGVIKP